MDFLAYVIEGVALIVLIGSAFLWAEYYRGPKQ